MAQIVLVDSKDHVNGAKERENLVPGDIYRVSALWLTNSKGDALLARRGLTKKKHPGLWGPAVAGTVESGESYDINIVKEIREEIGLVVTPTDLNPGPKMYIIGEANDYYCQWFLYRVDKAAERFGIQRDEVEEVKWFSMADLRALYEHHPEQMIPSASYWVPYFLG